MFQSRKTKIALISLALAAAIGFGLLFASPALAQTIDTGVDTVGSATGLSTTDIRITIGNIIRYILGFLGVIAICLVLYGGFLYMTSGGNQEQVTKAKKVLIDAVIGLIIIFSAYAIASYVINKLGAATGAAGFESSGSNDGRSGGLEASGELAFVARSISPKGDLDNYNVKVRVLFSQNVSDSTITADNIVITKHGESAGIPWTKEVSGKSAILTPLQKCPAPDNNLHCLDKNSDYDIQLKAGAIKANSGALGLSCEPAAACQAHFRTGGNLDKQGPIVTIEKPLDNAKVSADSSVDINVYAKDNSGVSNISFYVDNDSIAINGPENGNTRKDFYSGIVWDTNGARLGSHAIEALADDTAGNSGGKKISVSVLPAKCFDSAGRIKCGGTGCPKCDGASCRSNADCSGECVGGVCVSLPTITNVLPNEAAPGNLVSIVGSSFKYYDASKSKVYFIGSGGEYVEAKIGCQGKQSWTDNNVVVQVPDNAAAGPVKIVNKDNKYDTTENDRGWKGNFTRNDSLNYPGLCSVLLSGCDAACAGASCVDCQAGLMSQSVVAEGLGFGEPSGTSKVYFGDLPAQLGASAVWLANKITDIKIPNLDPGQINVSIGIGEKCVANDNSTIKPCDKGTAGCVCADIYSNPVKFKINEAANLPKIQTINPNPAPAGQYVTISGANFGSSVGRVQFISMQGEAFSASLPCADSGWSSTDVVVKAPSGLSAGVDYLVLLYTSDNIASNSKLFTASQGAPGPGICSISPDNGPIGTAVDFKGENFGSAGAYAIMFAKTGLDNDPGVAVPGQDIGAWTDTDISGALVPAGAVPGDVYIANKTNNTVQSNKISFKVGSCTASSCGVIRACCSSGVCVKKTTGQSDADACKSQVFSYASEYAWAISTGLLPQIPAVLERSCVTGELSESPSPARSFDSACPNAMISAAFNMLMNPDSLDNNIIIKRCKTAGEKCDFRQTTGNYELARIADVKTGDIGETNLAVTCKNAGNQTCVSGTTGCACVASGPKLTEFHLASSLSDYVGKVATRPIAGLSYYFLYSDTWYEVKIVGGQGGASSLRDEFLPSDYVWQFKTKADVCQPENLIVSPAKGLIDEMDARQKFMIFGQYRCQNIALSNYNWLWEVLDAYRDKAEFAGLGCDEGDGICADPLARHDVGIYQLNQSNIDSNGAAKIDFETPANDPVKISASTTVTAAQELGIEGRWEKDAELEIKFKEPHVVSYFPSCEAVCVNATILGATFNASMKASALNADNVKLYSCPDKDCAVLTPVDLNKVVYQSATKQAQIYANANFDSNKYYRVIMSDQVKSASGVGLAGLNYRAPGAAAGSPNNAFSWTFKTKNDNSVCKINSVALQPLSYVSEKPGEQVGYLSLPYSSPDECSAAGQALDPYVYSWSWSSDQLSVATISNNSTAGKGSPYQFATVVGNYTSPAFSFNDATKYTEGATNISSSISSENKSGATPLTFRTKQCVAGSVAIDQGAATPKNNESNVCRNALVYILLTDKAQTGDITSSNIQLSAQYLASETCPGQPAVKNENIIFKALAAVQNLFAKAGFAIGTKWCDVPAKSVDVTTTAGGKPEIVITPENLLPQNRLHRVLLTGLKNACFKMIPDMTLTFTTKDEACRLDNVKVDPEFNFIIKSNQSTAYKAWPRSGEQIIQNVAGKYEWTWKWTTSDSSIADFANDNATTSYNPTINTFAKNGQAQVAAAAAITVDKLGGDTDTTNTTAVGLGDIQVLICDNPWDPAGNGNWGVYDAKTSDGSYVSTYLFEKTNPNPMDVGLFYCRDFGSAGTADDLPKLSVSTDTASADTNPMLMRQYFFTRDPENLGGEAAASTDVISLRVYKNEEALPPDLWYIRYAPNPATGGAKTANVDCKTDSLGQYCYVGAKDGVSTYVAAANVIGNDIYDNIYLLGYSQGANAAKQNIYSQLLSLIKFNFQYQETLSGDKAAVIRDTKRVNDLVMMRAYLNQYKSAHAGAVPQLGAGTYVRGQTISVWPSWQKELGGALGRTLPLDPQNHFQYTGVSAGGGQSLVAYYPFTGNANDATDHANNGIVLGASLSTDKNNAASSAYHFAGNEYVELGSNSIFDLTDGLTISAWVNHESGNGHIVNKGGGWSDSGYSVFWFNNNIRVEIQDAGRGEKAILDNLAPGNDAWHHIAVTWDSVAKTITTYIDGAAKSNTATFNGPIGVAAQKLNIGRNDKHPDLDFKGKIDEVRIYNTALTASQIAKIYHDQNIALGQESDCSATTADAASSATALKCLANYQCAVPGKWCVNCPSDYDKLTCYKSVIVNNAPQQTFYDVGNNRPPESPVYMYRAIDASNYELKYRLETKEIYDKIYNVVPAL
ncbi:MAG: LamG-like jellyroll fold domain-containing protein [Parcubacteria group bacterium]